MVDLKVAWDNRKEKLIQFRDNVANDPAWKAAVGDTFDRTETTAVILIALTRWILIFFIALLVLIISQSLFSAQPNSLLTRLWDHLNKLALFISLLGFLADAGRVLLRDETLPPQILDKPDTGSTSQGKEPDSRDQNSIQTTGIIEQSQAIEAVTTAQDQETVSDTPLTDEAKKADTKEPKAQVKRNLRARHQRSFYNRAAITLFLVSLLAGALTFILANLQDGNWAISAPVLSLGITFATFILVLIFRPQYIVPSDLETSSTSKLTPAEAAKAVLTFSDNTKEKLTVLYVETIRKVQENIDWYTRNARLKKQRAQYLRFLSLAFIGIGGITPVIIDAFDLTISPSIATVIIAGGTGFIALDRFWGYSTAWIRFLKTEMELKSMLESFGYKWDLAVIKYGHYADKPMIEPSEIVQSSADDTSTETEIRDKATYITAMIERCQKLRSDVNEKVREETAMWVEEFQANLRSADGRITSTKTDSAG